MAFLGWRPQCGIMMPGTAGKIDDRLLVPSARHAPVDEAPLHAFGFNHKVAVTPVGAIDLMFGEIDR
jgi:hypothetical protein